MSKKQTVKKPSTTNGGAVRPVGTIFVLTKRFIQNIILFALYQFADNGLVSGRTGGNVKMRNGRSRGMKVPARVRNAYTSRIRSLFAIISSNFRTLTPAQIAAWNAYEFSTSDRFGVSHKQKGKSGFIRLNTYLTLVGGTNIYIPPVDGTAAEPVDLTTLTSTALTVSLSYNPVGAGLALIYATKPLSPGVSRPSQSAFRLIATADFTTASPIDLFSFYTAKFGTPIAGTKIMMQVRNINDVTGLPSAISQVESLTT